MVIDTYFINFTEKRMIRHFFSNYAVVKFIIMCFELQKVKYYQW